MKKIINSAGLVALGAASLQAAYGQNMAESGDNQKPWSVSVAVRGFYDSNYAVQNTGPNKGSYGVELSPTVSLNDSLQQTDFGVRYTYGLYYYQDREHL